MFLKSFHMFSTDSLGFHEMLWNTWRLAGRPAHHWLLWGFLDMMVAPIVMFLSAVHDMITSTVDVNITVHANIAFIVLGKIIPLDLFCMLSFQAYPDRYSWTSTLSVSLSLFSLALPLSISPMMWTSRRNLFEFTSPYNSLVQITSPPSWNWCMWIWMDSETFVFLSEHSSIINPSDWTRGVFSIIAVLLASHTLTLHWKQPWMIWDYLQMTDSSLCSCLENFDSLEASS